MTIKINNGEFVFFCCNEGNADLLKQEIKSKYPHLNLSYSANRFLTYKTTKDIMLEEISIVFATRYGKSLYKTSKEKFCELGFDKNYVLESRRVCHTFSLLENCVTNAEIDQLIIKHNEQLSLDDLFINLIEVRENEYWIGIHSKEQVFPSVPNSNPGIMISKDAPSRAYLKIAEAIKLFNISLRENQKWLELGSAPGGASFYLLENKVKLWGNDPAEMSEICLKHPNFKHIKKPFQHITLKDIPSNVEWITVDLNLNPKQVLTEVFELCGKLPKIKGLLITIKIVNPSHVDHIEDNIKWAQKKGFKHVQAVQLPSHKREYLLLIKN